LIDDVKIPLAFRRIQAADLKDWEGKLPHPGFDNLLKAVAGILGRPLAVQPSQKAKDVRDREPEKVHISIEEPEKIAKQGNSIGMKFSLIPAGKFYMGSEERNDEKPVHKVKINNPFYLGTYPVTQREWNAVMGDNNNPSNFKGDDLPVEKVSWDKVQEFIKKLNEKEGTGKYRLPSEAEWEYACRAGTTTRYSFGDDESILGDYAWYAGSFAAVAGTATPGSAVLRFAPSASPAPAPMFSAFAFLGNCSHLLLYHFTTYRSCHECVARRQCVRSRTAEETKPPMPVQMCTKKPR
jgi:hypothetical protein